MTACLSAKSLTCLPMPTGPYVVGIAQYDLTDPSRKEIEYPQGRLIPVQIYFPMERGVHTLHDKLLEKRTPGNWPPLNVQVYGQKSLLTSLTTESKHPIIFLNHGDTVAMTDYAFIAEDLASNGYVVVCMQHQLRSDPQEPKYREKRSIQRYARIIDTILFVFEWLKDTNTAMFKASLDLKKVGFIGHSMGGNALLFFAHRASNIFEEKQNKNLLPHEDSQGVQEAIVVLDPKGVSYPPRNMFPLLLLLAEEQQAYQKESGAHEDMVKLGHKVIYYKGAKHVSFMDHGYIDPVNPLDANEHYFDGSCEERKAFFDRMRKDLREFLIDNGVGN